MPPHFSIPVVIMAGGEGRRIGGDKASRMLGGKSLLDHVVSKAMTYSQALAVAVSPQTTQRLADEIPLLVDEVGKAGPISGLASALRHAAALKAQHVLIISCDTPFLPEDLLERLRASIGNANAAMAQYEERLHSACALWRTDVLDALPDYLAHGRRSLIGFAKTVGYVAVGWPVGDFDPFFNINTPGDLVVAEQYLADMPSHE